MYTYKWYTPRPRKSRERSISLLHFKWPKNISFRSKSTVPAPNSTVSLCARCCLFFFSFFFSRLPFSVNCVYIFFYIRVSLIWFLHFCLSAHIIHMYYDYYCFCFSFGHKKLLLSTWIVSCHISVNIIFA